MKGRFVRLTVAALAVVMLTAVAGYLLAPGVVPYASAQQPPTPTPTPPVPTPPVIPAPAVPTYSFKGPAIEVPGEARQAIPEKDFIDVFYLTSRWQVELFYKTMDVWALGFEQLQGVAGPMGIQLDLPDIPALKAEARAKLDAVGTATTLEAAQTAVGNLLSFGSTTQDRFMAVGKRLEARFREEGVRIQAKVEAEAGQYALQEQTRAQNEMQTQLLAMIAQSMSGGPGSIPDPQAIKSRILAQMDSLVQQKIREVTQNIESYVKNLVDKDVAPLKRLDTLLNDLAAKAAKARTGDSPEVAGLKRQAIAKRKALIARMLDVNIARARTQLDGVRANLAAAKRLDPSVKTADDILAELDRDRQTLERKLDALLSGDIANPETEVQFRAAIEEFTAKWTALAQQAEKQRPNALSIKDRARPQLVAAKAQLTGGAQAITQLLGQAIGKNDPQSQAINAQAAQLSTLRDRINALAGRVDHALETLDKATADSPIKPIMELLDKIQSDREALQRDVQASKARDSKRESVLIQAEDEVSASVSKPGTSWDSTEEVRPSWRAGWTGSGDWYLSRQGDALTYTFSVQNPGVFYLWVRDWDDGNHPPGSGAIDITFSWSGGSAELKNVPENSVRNSQHQWHQVGQVTLGSASQSTVSMKVVKSATTSKAAILDAFFLSSDPQERPPESPPPTRPRAVETILIQAENEVSASVSKPGSNWDSAKEVRPSWRAGWTGSGDWYLSRRGDALTYTFSVQNPGVFYLWVRDWDDGKHLPGSGAIDITFSWSGGSAELKNVPENSVRNSQHQWHQVGQVTLGSASQSTVSMKVVKSATTSKAAVLDAFFLSSDSAIRP